MRRNVKKNILSIVIAGTLAMLPTLSHAQDTLRISMITQVSDVFLNNEYFEYDEFIQCTQGCNE